MNKKLIKKIVFIAIAVVAVAVVTLIVVKVIQNNNKKNVYDKFRTYNSMGYSTII